ncbi:MAG: M20/M25/M40 family metallo-hydrolase [Chitinophagaceae bacterium]|nr:M20/M25/M40 family metallo-hydrolase [Chitinophagaceae bacterium]
MIRIYLTFLLISASTIGFCQKGKNVINQKEVERIEAILSDNNMEGRRTGTPGIAKAADFIASEFKKAGLTEMAGVSGCKQNFTMLKSLQSKVTGDINDQAIDPKNVVVFTAQKRLDINSQSGYKKVTVKQGDNLLQEAQKFIGGKENIVVIADTSFTRAFAVLSRFKRALFKSETNVVFILSSQLVTSFKLSASQELEEMQMANVVGVLPGKSKKNEYVVFSAHYDHLGIGKAVNGDSIYNGANDDASGTTAVITLAKYYKALGGNERTLIFAAFTAEEIGGFGSQYFSKQLNPADVVAMFNIEMIGTESKWNKASAYITGYEKTNMGSILEKNLEGTKFKFYPDPYPDEQLFYRSDNATLAGLGVPAHTISTSKMDVEPNYHKVSDEIGTLDMENMTEIIKAIAKSATSIVNGKDAPSRVKVEDLSRY